MFSRLDAIDAQRTQLMYSHMSDEDEVIIPIRRCAYHTKYINALNWLVLLIVGYIFNRIICVTLHIPEDYLEMSFLGHVITLANLLLMGFMQGWFCDVIEDTARNRALFKSKIFIFVYFTTFPVFALVGDWSFLAHSVTSDKTPPLDFAIFLFCLSLVVLMVVAWHIAYARKVFRLDSDFKAYYVGRLVAFCFFLGSLLLAEADGKPIVIHLHHYFLAWIISLFAVFNHPVSIVTLAISVAIFVQGLSTYSAAAIIFRPTEARPLPNLHIF